MGYLLIAISIDGADPAAALKILGENLGDVKAPLTQVLEMGLLDARMSIESQGALYGDGWAGMSPFTPIVARKLYGKSRDGLNLLDDSGALIASLFPGGPQNVLEVGESEGEAGTAAVSPRSGFPIGKGQQEGTAATFHVLQGHGFSYPGIPGRFFLGWYDARLEDYTDVFARHVWDGVDGASEGPGVRI